MLVDLYRRRPQGGILRIAPALAQRAAALGGEVYVEHWHDDPVPGGTWPEKAWFPAPPELKDSGS